MSHEGQRPMGATRERTSLTEREGGGTVAERAREVTDKGREKGREAAGRAREKVEQVAEEQRSAVVSRASHLAGALRAAADSLAGEDEDRLSEYGRRAAEQADRFAGYIERKDVRTIVSDLRHTARRRPGAFLGGGFVAGLLVGRFLRSTAPDDGGDHVTGRYRDE